MSVSFPCKNCKDKYFGCHGVCSAYLVAVEENERKKEHVRREKEKLRILTSYRRYV